MKKIRTNEGRRFVADDARTSKPRVEVDSTGSRLSYEGRLVAAKEYGHWRLGDAHVSVIRVANELCAELPSQTTAAELAGAINNRLGL